MFILTRKPQLEGSESVKQRKKDISIVMQKNEGLSDSQRREQTCKKEEIERLWLCSIVFFQPQSKMVT